MATTKYGAVHVFTGESIQKCSFRQKNSLFMALKNVVYVSFLKLNVKKMFKSCNKILHIQKINVHVVFKTDEIRGGHHIRCNNLW